MEGHLIVNVLLDNAMSEKEIRKRYKYKNPELLDAFGNKGKGIIIVGAHQGNWEWSTSMPLATNIKVLGA